MDWVRRRKLGSGAFPTVYLASKRDDSDLFPPLMAVKSSKFSFSQSLRHEREFLRRLDSCPEIIRCFGDDITVERGQKLYNLVLEYASGGSLLHQLDMYGGRLPESLVRRYTRGILKGLDFIHSKGFVHCDIKLRNILVVDNGDVKIANFGLAKMAGEEISTEEGNFELRGRSLSVAPESVTDNEYESPCDIWALACAAVEMCTGKSAWNLSNNCAASMGIGVGMEVPVIPTDLSEEGKDFLEKCFIKDPTKRWSAQMLLNHPFVADDPVPSKQPMDSSSLPRSPVELPDWFSHSYMRQPRKSSPSPRYPVELPDWFSHSYMRQPRESSPSPRYPVELPDWFSHSYMRQPRESSPSPRSPVELPDWFSHSYMRQPRESSPSPRYPVELPDWFSHSYMKIPKELIGNSTEN